MTLGLDLEGEIDFLSRAFFLITTKAGLQRGKLNGFAHCLMVEAKRASRRLLWMSGMSSNGVASRVWRVGPGEIGRAAIARLW
jgi:hypothetical protein